MFSTVPVHAEIVPCPTLKAYLEQKCQTPACLTSTKDFTAVIIHSIGSFLRDFSLGKYWQIDLGLRCLKGIPIKDIHCYDKLEYIPNKDNSFKTESGEINTLSGQ